MSYEETLSFKDFKEEWMCAADTLNIPVEFYYDEGDNVLSVSFAHPRKLRVSAIMIKNPTKEQAKEVSHWYLENASKIVIESFTFEVKK